MNKFLIFSFLILLLIPFNFLAEAFQVTSITPKNVRISEKEFYNVISMDIHFMIPDIRVNDFQWFYINQISITDDKGRNHTPDDSECRIAGGMYNIDGKRGKDQYYTPCYSVEKDFKNFKVYYTPFGKKSTEIGSFMVNQYNQIVFSNEGQACIRIMTQAEKDANPNRIEDGIKGEMHNGECITDNGVPDIGSFFSGFWNMLRSWFHF